MKLLGYKTIKADVELLTGLHIGGSEESSQIGAIDNPVIRLQKNNMPYIPGSSLKGKMRALLELAEDRVKVNSKGEGEVCDCGVCPICILFGSKKSKGPARLTFRDSYVNEKDKDTEKLIRKSKGMLSEEKAEVTIDRINGKAGGGGPRKIERVPAGVHFNLEISMKVFDSDNAEELTKTVEKGLKLIEFDSLGGSGSRGYGRIKFNNIEISELQEI